MKICLPVDSVQGFGGGFTFQRNLEKGLRLLGHQVVESANQADISLISGVTMVTKETIFDLLNNGRKFVVRLDNVPRNSRNRNTGSSRLKGFAEKADGVIWQSKWAKEYLLDFVKKDGRIIYDGVDQEIFNPEGALKDFHNKREDTYLYSRFSRDETKQWEHAWYEYQLIQKQNPYAKLIIVGNYLPELVNFGFDFFRGERIEYMDVIRDEKEMANILRGCSKYIATYYNDAFCNTYLEALSCGMALVKVDMSGGTPEMLQLWKEKGREYFGLERMAKEYVEYFEQIIGG